MSTKSNLGLIAGTTAIAMLLQWSAESDSRSWEIRDRQKHLEIIMMDGKRASVRLVYKIQLKYANFDNLGTIVEEMINEVKRVQ